MLPATTLDQNEGFEQPSPVVKLFRRLKQWQQYYLDAWTPYPLSRWCVAVGLLVLFVIRIIVKQGWYIITYGLFIYHLNLLLLFLTPKIDPALAEYEDDGLALPTKSNEEFRPFMRRLPEFKFWYSMTKATLIALVCTCFEFLNIPVFWPILVMYFITLFLVTMKRQIKHMIQYKYLPFTWGKPKYQGNVPPAGPVIKS